MSNGFLCTGNKICVTWHCCDIYFIAVVWNWPRISPRYTCPQMIFYKCFSSSCYNLEVVDCQNSEFRELLHSSPPLAIYQIADSVLLSWFLSSFLTIRSQLLVNYLLRYLSKIHWFKRCYHVGECILSRWNRLLWKIILLRDFLNSVSFKISPWFLSFSLMTF